MIAGPMKRLSTFANAGMIMPALGLIFAFAGGCSSKLETGYKPRMLGSSPEVRRGYYAQPFTPEATKAKQYEQDFGTPGGSRPRPGD
ncbi:MAG: hypothetical protein QOE14_495 [Humisphaera sp.]|nr:hypothetical protein [Humisphaera sp.]